VVAVNLVDVALVLLFVTAVVGGARVGFLARVLTWIGLALGALLATRTVPLALDIAEDASANVRFVLALAVLTVTVSVGGSVLGAVGLYLRRGLGTGSLPRLDRVAGGVAGGLMVLAATWFLLPAAANVPGPVAASVRGSAVAGAVQALTPPPPDAAETLRALVDSSRFPEVVADLSPAPVTGPPPETIEVDPEVVERVTASTVRVTARGCGRRFDGSGVTVRTDTVLTNAHVVAGADAVVLRRPDGREVAGTVVAFDPRRDLAVVEAPGLGQEPLPLGEAEVGQSGVSVGYPGGQAEPRAAPVVVNQRRTAVGKDIYGLEETERSVLFLAAELRQGDSGSPLVDAGGDIIGIVFAISPDRRTTAYALDRPEIDAILAAPRVTGATGRCVQ